MLLILQNTVNKHGLYLQSQFYVCNIIGCCLLAERWFSVFLVALLQFNFFDSLAGPNWRLKIRQGWSLCRVVVHYQLIILRAEGLGGIYPSNNGTKGVFINMSLCLSEPSCHDIRNPPQKSVGYWMFFTVKERKVNRAEALTKHQAEPDEEAVLSGRDGAWPDPSRSPPRAARPCAERLQASWSRSCSLQTSCCFPNRPPELPKCCSMYHKLKLILIRFSGLDGRIATQSRVVLQRLK